MDQVKRDANGMYLIPYKWKIWHEYDPENPEKTPPYLWRMCVRKSPHPPCVCLDKNTCSCEHRIDCECDDKNICKHSSMIFGNEIR